MVAHVDKPDFPCGIGRMTTRRNFLRMLGLATTGAVLTGPDVLEAFARLTHVRKSFPSANLAPKLWGDGIHDDTAALQYLIDNASRSAPLYLRSGTYAIGKTLTLRDHTHITNTHLRALPTLSGAVIHVPNPKAAASFHGNFVMCA